MATHKISINSQVKPDHIKAQIEAQKKANVKVWPKEKRGVFYKKTPTPFVLRGSSPLSHQVSHQGLFH